MNERSFKNVAPNLLDVNLTPGYNRSVTVRQHDLRSVRIELGAFQVLLGYGFTFDGHERLPESVALDRGEATAFFLSATVRDQICCPEWGATVDRTWSVLQSGSARLELAMDIRPLVPLLADRVRAGARRASQPAALLRAELPGLGALESGGAEVSMLHGRTTLPGSVLLFAGEAGLCAFVHSRGEGRSVSVGVRVLAGEGEEHARVTWRVPPLELLPRRPGPYRSREAGEADIEDAAGLSASLGVSLVVGRSRDVHARALAVALGAPPGSPSAPSGAPKKGSGAAGRPPERCRGWILPEEIERFEASHLVEQGSVCALSLTAGSPMASAAAGASYAASLCRLFPGNNRRQEQTRRLADFCLTGQHPSGVFYDRFDLRRQRWVGLGDGGSHGGGEAPRVSFPDSCDTAAALFDLSRLLDARGVSSGRYVEAARRFVERFVDARGQAAGLGSVLLPDASEFTESGPGAVRFLAPLLRLWRLEEREAYRKAARDLVERFLAAPPSPWELPASRPGRDPDCRAALLLVEAAMEALEHGLRVPGTESFARLLLRWVYVDSPGDERPGLQGALLESEGRSRLRVRGSQVAYLCLRARRQMRGSAPLLEAVARASLAASSLFPMGTAWVRHDLWSGPEGPGHRRTRSARGVPEAPGFRVPGCVDAREFVMELGYHIRLREDFGAELRMEM